MWSGGDSGPGKTRGKSHSTCSPQDGSQSVHVDWRQPKNCRGHCTRGDNKVHCLYLCLDEKCELSAFLLVEAVSFYFSGWHNGRGCKG